MSTESMSDDNPLLTAPPPKHVRHLYRDTVDVRDELHIVCYCGETVRKKYVPLDFTGEALPDNVVRAIEATDCPVCVDKWETEPQPVTTADLVRVLGFIDALAYLFDPKLRLRAEILELRQAMQRPRRKPR